MTANPKKSVLVIGIGNSLRGDDGAGNRVAERLSEQAGNRIRCLSVSQLTMEFVDDIVCAKRVIFIDASVNCSPGEIAFTEITPESRIASLDSHRLTPYDLVSLCFVLNRTAPRSFFYEIGGQQFGYGESLSKPVEEAVSKLISDILASA